MRGRGESRTFSRRMILDPGKIAHNHNKTKKTQIKAIPPHHEADPLHILQVQRLRIRLRLPSVGRLQILKRNDHLPPAGARAASSLGRRRLAAAAASPLLLLSSSSSNHKVVLPAHGALLAAVGPLRQHRVLEREGVPLGVGARDVQDQRGAPGQVPGVVIVDGALRGEAGAAEGLDVQGA